MAKVIASIIFRDVMLFATQRGYGEWENWWISLVFLGIILWGTICYYDWDIRWTNSAKFQVFKELLGRDGIRIFNGVIIVVAMLALTYFFLH